MFFYSQYNYFKEFSSEALLITNYLSLISFTSNRPNRTASSIQVCLQPKFRRRISSR